MQIKPLHITTPLLHSTYLACDLPNKDIYYKLEALQPGGSFKIRGIGRLCQEYANAGISEFMASSGGNAGIAVAYAGMRLGIPTTIYIPTTSHPVYIEMIKHYKATVVVAGDVWDEAHAAATKACESHGNAAYIPPFNHPTLWAGHATMVHEMVPTGVKPDVVIAAVGGGGLACGILQGLHEVGWADVPLVAVETKGADSFYQSVQAGKIVTLDKITSRATSLGAKRIADALWDWNTRHTIHSLVVSDDQAESACRRFAHEERILVELSAGAALSLVYEKHPILKEYKHIVVIVCGGINTTFLI